MKVSTRVEKLEKLAGAVIEESEPFNELFKTIEIPEDQWESLERQLKADGFHTQRQFAEYLLNQVDGATRGINKTLKEKEKLR